MLFNIAVKHGGPVLLIIGSGPARYCDMCALIDVAARVSRMQGYQRVLVDVLAVSPDVTAEEHARVGEHAAQSLGHFERVALVVASDTRSGLGELAAQRGGLKTRTFTDLHSAEAWLAAV
jgi:hypothetical protein